MSKVVIDHDACTGCTNCTEIAPEVFEMDENEEKARVIMPEGGPEDLIEEAIESCPEDCIHRQD